MLGLPRVLTASAWGDVEAVRPLCMELPHIWDKKRGEGFRFSFTFSHFLFSSIRKPADCLGEIGLSSFRKHYLSIYCICGPVPDAETAVVDTKALEAADSISSTRGLQRSSLLSLPVWWTLEALACCVPRQLQPRGPWRPGPTHRGSHTHCHFPFSEDAVLEMGKLSKPCLN